MLDLDTPAVWQFLASNSSGNSTNAWGQRRGYAIAPNGALAALQVHVIPLLQQAHDLHVVPEVAAHPHKRERDDGQLHAM